MLELHGYKVIINDDAVPKLSVKAKYLFSKRVVDEFNKYLADTFGYYKVCKDGEYTILGVDTLVMNSKTYKDLRKRLYWYNID